MLKSGNRISISIKKLSSHPHISGWDSHVQLGWVHNNYVVLPCRFLSSQHQATLKGNATYCEPTLRDMECTSKQAHKLSKILRVCNFATITNKVYTVPQRSKRPLYFFVFQRKPSKLASDRAFAAFYIPCTSPLHTDSRVWVLSTMICHVYAISGNWCLSAPAAAQGSTHLSLSLLLLVLQY